MFDHEFRIQDVVRILYRHKNVVLLCLFLVAGVVMLMIKMEEPQYKSVVKLTVLNRSITDVIKDNVDTGTHLTIANQLDVLQSQSFLERVVAALPPDIYDDYAIYSPTPVMKAMDAVKALVRKVLGMTPPDMTPKALAIENIARKMGVRHQGGGVIQISFKSADPHKAQKVAEIIANQFIQFNIENLKKRLTIVRNYFDRQIQKAYQDMKQAELALEQFKKEKGLTSAQGESVELGMRLNSLESSYVEVKTQRELAEKRLRTLNQKINELAANFPDVKNIEKRIPEINALKQKLTALEKERMLASAIYTDKHPKMVSLTTRIQQTIKDLRALTRSAVKDTTRLVQEIFTWQDLYVERVLTEVEISSLKGKEESYKKLIDNYRHKILYELPDKERGLVQLTQKLEMAKQRYQSVVNNSERISMVEAEKVGNVQVLTPATLPVVPDTKHQTLKMIFSIFMGTLLGIVMAFFMEWYNSSVRTIEDLETRLELPVLGAIPDFKMARKHDKKLNPKGDPENTNPRLSGIYVFREPDSIVTESFRRLFSEIELMGRQLHPFGKALVISSAGPNEGKSTVAANLAVTMAMSGRKVALIDGDLRRPTLHTLFGVDRNFGLVDLLNGTDAVERYLPDLSKKKRHLELITSGKSVKNPLEVLSSRKMRRFLKLLRLRYDYILIDTPPLVTFSDALLVTSFTDGILLVARSGRTPLQAVERTKSMIKKAGITLTGSILNGINYKKEYGPSSYYEQYYKSYYHRYVRESESAREVAES